MKVYAYPADLYGCGHYRLIWPGEACAGDVDVVLVTPGDQTMGIGALANKEGVVTGALAPPDADVILLQRPSHPTLVQCIPFWRKKGIAVVVDIDDDLSHIHPANVAYAAMHPQPRWEIEPLALRQQVHAVAEAKGVPWPIVYQQYLKQRSPHSWACVKDAARDATLVTVSTPALTKVYGRGNTLCLHNYVPSRFCDIPHEDSDRIGWAGSTHSHPGDLRAMNGAMTDIPGDFLVVGDGTGADRDLSCPVTSTGAAPFDEWIPAVSQLGIGVAPLQDSRFNQAKSWLKPLEYSAAGVPWVASPRAEYSALHELGAGLLAERRREWTRHLRTLVNDSVYRTEQSLYVRAVARALTIEEHGWRWAEAWAAAIEVEHRHRMAMN